MLLGEIHLPGIQIGEKALHPADLESADEVFITSTTRDLLPVRKIEGKTLAGSNRARAVLQKAFSDFVARYVAEHTQVAR